MRLSVDHSDPGLDAWLEHRDRGIVVKVDGVVVLLPITADEEAGYVLAHEADADGNPILDRAKAETRKVELRGAVTIEFLR